MERQQNHTKPDEEHEAIRELFSGHNLFGSNMLIWTNICEQGFEEGRGKRVPRTSEPGTLFIKEWKFRKAELHTEDFSSRREGNSRTARIL